MASPPLRSSSQTWLPRALPGRPEVNDRYLPSGLNRGELSLSLLKVSWRSLLPSMFTIQMCELDLYSFASVEPSTYATHCPSGDSCGSSTLRKRVRSSRRSGCRADWAANEKTNARASKRGRQFRRLLNIEPPKMWLLERALREGSLHQRRYHTKAQSRATKAQRRNWNLFVALWLGFVPLCEKTTRRARRIAVPVRS